MSQIAKCSQCSSHWLEAALDAHWPKTGGAPVDFHRGIYDFPAPICPSTDKYMITFVLFFGNFSLIYFLNEIFNEAKIKSNSFL